MHNKIFLGAMFLFLPLLFAACKKDMDRKTEGTYKGKASFIRYKYSNLSTPVIDTLYEDVVITVQQNESSRRGNAKVNIHFLTVPQLPGSLENVSLSHGMLHYYSTDRGVSTSHLWSGHITYDSLNLVYEYEDRIMYKQEYRFTAGRTK